MHLNDGNGWGWEYRVITFTSDGATPITLTFNWKTASNNWCGLDDIELRINASSANLKVTDGKLGTFVAPFDVTLPQNVKGYIMNPVGCSVVITPQLIDQVLKNFPEEVQKGAEETRKLMEAQAAAAKASVKAPVNAPVKAPLRAPLANGHSKITKMPEKK